MASTAGYSALFLSVYLLLCFPLALSLHNDLREANFYKLDGKSLNGSLTERHRTPDAQDCSFLCVNAVNRNCFSFNFGGTENQGLYECELSNSEMKLTPEKLQDRKGFAYYGMKEESLYSYLPCVSSPCQHGKECSTRPFRGLYSCSCPLEDIGLKFTDDKCAVDMKQISKAGLVAKVGYTRFAARRLNFYEAEKLCKLLNATIASYDQLYAAWEAGAEHCAPAWISNARAAFPRQNKVSGCGNLVGIFQTAVQDKDKSRHNVWCYYY